MPYSPEKPRLVESSEQLKARIPGWGADIDPKDRPSVPRQRFDPSLSGAHWQEPDRQPQRWPREHSIEHAGVTPVFGTACPPHGVSGAIRRLAYARYSEARAAHWLLLMAADRVESKGSILRSFVSLRPDNSVTETGVRAELSHSGWSSRIGRGRADLTHQWMDPVIVGGPWLVTAGVLYAAGKRARRRRRR